MQLTWHDYRYYPYERDLALREIEALLSPTQVSATKSGVVLDGLEAIGNAARLTYFAEIQAGPTSSSTSQRLLEQINGNGRKRQSTRYSAHGLHEYKGKFNPQVAKALLNMFNAAPGSIALDPFCGSGTSLVECAHLGVQGIGFDINPLAAFIAGAKLQALDVEADRLREDVQAATLTAKKSKAKPDTDAARGQYLASWFDADVLAVVERLRTAIHGRGGATEAVMLAIASNLLRDYSLQEPSDLRIRRRSSPMPEIPFLDAFLKAGEMFAQRLAHSQSVLGRIKTRSRAVLKDSRQLVASDLPGKADLALTSPPYATALPYIDTQRLSLVWLSLISPSEILPLEAELVGSREVRSTRKRELLDSLMANGHGIPSEQHQYCVSMQEALDAKDGFRRQLAPSLLYRYFSGMSTVFERVHSVMKTGAPFGLIVGGNHTVLGGKRFDIDTPAHLASLAEANGWQHLETIELQTYQRFGLHASNATTKEALVVLAAS